MPEGTIRVILPAAAIVLLALGFSALAGASDTQTSRVTLATPHVIDLPLERFALDGVMPRFALLDGAGIGGVDGASGGPTGASFVHLEDVTVCGAGCILPNTTVGDETVTAFCPPSTGAAWPWHWSSGVSSGGNPACASVADATWFVSDNGFIGPIDPKCASVVCYTPNTVPSTGGPNGQIYGDWQDLDNTCTTAPNGVYAASGGSPGNRYFIVEWWNVKHWSASGCAAETNPQQFEIIQFEADGSAAVIYAASGTTSTALGGEENSAGTAALSYFRTSSVPQNTGIIYFDAQAPTVSTLNATCASPGNAGWCRATSFSVKAADNNDTGPGGKVGTGVRYRNLSVDGGAPVAYVNNTAQTLTLDEGVHTLNATATDWGLRVGSRALSVSIDTTPPTLAAHANVAAEATSASGASVTYDTPIASDAGSGPGPVACSPASGSAFPLGTSTVTCSASDIAGNGPATTSFTVTVSDTTPPTVDAPPSVSVEATSAAGAPVSFASPPSHDAVSGDGSSTCAPPSGSTFPLGTTTVTCRATDAAGNTGQSTFTVRVVDTTAPTLDAHDNVVAEATSASGAGVTYTSPAWHDAVSGDGTATCSPASGATFPLGSTTVTCNAADGAGNSAFPTSFTVSVRDTTAPTIDAHGAVVGEATGPQGGAVSYTSPRSRDAVDGDGTASCAPASGSTFPLGDSTVTCNARDAAGNDAAPKTFRVTVRDTTAPVIDAHPDVDVEASSPAGAIVTYTPPTTRDLVDGDGVASCAPASGSTFPVGATSVTCNGADAAGNAASVTHFTVHVDLQVRFTLQMEHGFYDVRDALATGVHAVATVKTGDGSPLVGIDVQLVVTRVLATGALDSATLVETTGADGTATFSIPAQFALPGTYSVVGTSLTTGIHGTAQTSYTVGVTSIGAAVQAPRGRIQ